MKRSNKLVVFNFFRFLLKVVGLDRLLPVFTKNKGYDNFFVKCLPQNYQYSSGTFRKVQRNGVWFNLDLSEYMEWVIYFDLNVENREDLYPLIREGATVFDVGSNIGETALHFAKISGQNGRVIGFEPVPETYRKCALNLSLNNFSNLKVENIAISDKREVLYFDPATYNNSGGIFMKKGATDTTMSVDAMTLDEYCLINGIEKLDFIKVDVEGFELNVLKGAAIVLEKLRPVLYVEINNHNLSRQNASAAEVIGLLKNAGYLIQRCGGGDVLTGPDSHFDIIARPV
jgi:FkbM family methyltransferase